MFFCLRYAKFVCRNLFREGAIYLYNGGRKRQDLGWRHRDFEFC